MVVVTVCLLVSACRSSPVPQYYLLELPSSGLESTSASSERKTLSVGVGRFRVEPPYDAQRLVYRPTPSTPEVGFYDYHRWAVPLENAVPALLAELLDRHPTLSAEPFPGRNLEAGDRSYDAVVTGRITRFEERDDGGSIQVAIGLDLTIEVGSRAVQRLRVDSTQEVGRSEVVAVVEAFVQALEEASERLAEKIR